MIRREFVRRKLQLIADDLERLLRFSDETLESLVADDLKLAAVERILERIVMRAINVTDDLRAREEDIIWRLRYREGWLYIYLLLEFQSTVDPYMAVRILTYVGLLYQDLIKAQHVVPGQKLPPVFPLVLYNGSPRWRAAEDIGELITPLGRVGTLPSPSTLSFNR